jgi:serine protease
VIGGVVKIEHLARLCFRGDINRDGMRDAGAVQEEVFMRVSRFASAKSGAILLGGAAALTVAAAVPTTSAASSGAGGASLSRIIKLPTLQHHADCFPPVVVSVACGGAGTPMTSGGGTIQTSPAVYIVYWGWNGRDPSGQQVYQEKFFNGVGGSTWAASQTQYCENATNLGATCTTGPFAGNPSGVLKGTWADNTNAVPSHPADADIAAEAARAAAHFGNTTAASNASTQYVIDTPQGNSSTGFNTSWCSWHSWSTTYGGFSFTNFPYITDAGGNCGQNFVNSGSAGLLDGVSIVGGHEYAESVTDPGVGVANNYGWTDTIGAETGDKCAWIQTGPGASTNVSTSTGSFAVQSLWSNSANSGAGGCVTYYASASNQH